MEIDTSTDFGARVARRLREDQMGWLTTVRADGLPQPTPVWFLWDGETFLIYSQPKQQKLRNIEGNPKVSLHLDGPSAHSEQAQRPLIAQGVRGRERRGRPGPIPDLVARAFWRTIVPTTRVRRGSGHAARIPPDPGPTE